MAINVLGSEVCIARVGARQAAQRGPSKRNKPLVVFKKKPVVNETPYNRAQWIKLAEAAIAMRGRTFEEVVANVRTRAVGATLPDSVREERKRARYADADAKLAAMRRRAAGRYETEMPGIF